MHKSGGRQHEKIFEADFLTQPSLGPLSLASPPRKQELTGNDGAPLCVCRRNLARVLHYSCATIWCGVAPRARRGTGRCRLGQAGGRLPV